MATGSRPHAAKSACADWEAREEVGDPLVGRVNTAGHEVHGYAWGRLEHERDWGRERNAKGAKGAWGVVNAWAGSERWLGEVLDWLGAIFGVGRDG